jgi:hypothetical protein
MKRPTFLEGVGVAIAASLAGSVLYTAMDVVFPGGPVLRLLIAGIGLAYVIYLLSRSPEHVGRITATAAWALVAGVLWFTEPPLLPYVFMHLGAIWLIRSLYFYSSALSALADLGLNGLSLAAAIWARRASTARPAGISPVTSVQTAFNTRTAQLRLRHANFHPTLEPSRRYSNEIQTHCTGIVCLYRNHGCISPGLPERGGAAACRPAHYQPSGQ